MMSTKKFYFIQVVILLIFTGGLSCESVPLAEDDEDEYEGYIPLYDWLDGQKYYYSFDEKKYLNEVSNKVVLRFDEKYLSKIFQYLQENEWVNIEQTIDHYNCYILTTKEGTDIKALMEELKRQKGTKSVNPVYILADFISPEMYITDEITVKFKISVSRQQIDEIHKKYNAEVKDTDEFRQLLSFPRKFDPLEVANVYQESGLVEYSCPNFISKIEAY